MSIFDRNSQSFVFENDEAITFSDGTTGAVEDIRLRRINIRPQVSDSGDLYGVVSISFFVDEVIACDADGEVHPLCEMEGWVNKVSKRIETEKWVPWSRLPALMPLIQQAQQAGYEVESSLLSYRQVETFFSENPKKTTLDGNDSTWLQVRAPQGENLLPASFVAQVGDLQKGLTESLFAGVNDLATLIAEYAPKMKEGNATVEEQRQFNMLIGNVFGFHEDNKGNRWGNKLSINSVTVGGSEYSLYFNPNRQQVSDLSAIFDVDTTPEPQKKADIEGLFDGA